MPSPEPDPPRRRSDAAANVGRILETARRLLAHDPEVPVATIAARAGVGRSTLYRHFPTRDALVQAVRRRARDLADGDEPQSLRPAGELTGVSSSPLSVPDVLNKVPPHLLGQQIVAEAQRLPGVHAAAVYLADLEGRVLGKLAGGPAFPARLPVGGTVGTEIPREAFGPVATQLALRLPGARVVPLTLRSRAIGLLVVTGPGDDALRDLAREAAAALALADGYTDALQTVRRVRSTSPAAEIQQNLLPARIVRIGGATLAGNVLPGYDVGGDWFDVAENADGVWFGIADVDGSGPEAAGLAAILLGAFRSARRGGEDPAGAATLMHEVLSGIDRPRTTASITVGCWSTRGSLLRWVTCGPPGALLVAPGGAAEELPGSAARIGEGALPTPLEVRARRLAAGERLVLLSDGVLDCADPSGRAFGADRVGAALRSTDGATAARTVRAIEEAVREHRGQDDLHDDATIVVLAPHAPGHRD